ncbi:MAG TPA: periplasmic heavy metal sensor [Chthoniobacterales bacterium]|jgi:hypothetical protein
MKVNKLVLLAAATLLSCGTLAQAQGDDAAPPFHHGPRNVTAMLTRALNLNEAQKAQVAAKVKEVQPQLDAIHEQARKQADAIIKQLNEQIRPLLDAQQQKRLDAIETLRETQPAPPGPE